MSKRKVTSIQYVHDPEAAEKWMDCLMEIIKKQFMKDVLHRHKSKKD